MNVPRHTFKVNGASERWGLTRLPAWLRDSAVPIEVAVRTFFRKGASSRYWWGYLWSLILSPKMGWVEAQRGRAG